MRFALVKDGWEILTEDYSLEYGGDRLYVDIAAEKSIAAEKQDQKILVEVKSFLGRSFIYDKRASCRSVYCLSRYNT